MASFVPSLRRGVLMVALALASAAGCATTNWADEPGKAVPFSHAANEEAGDQFLNALTAAREAVGLTAPVVTPRYQSEIRNFADDLQTGKTSAPAAQRAITDWGHRAFQTRVAAWALDCGGPSVQIPEALVHVESAVVSFAAAHFRPQSSNADQCAVLVISVQPH